MIHSAHRMSRLNKVSDIPPDSETAHKGAVLAWLPVIGCAAMEPRA